MARCGTQWLHDCIDKARFVCQWNGGVGQGPGRMPRMYNEVKRRTGLAPWIDIRQL